jgi:tRNA (guanine9-N1)-methyltransferase
MLKMEEGERLLKMQKLHHAVENDQIQIPGLNHQQAEKPSTAPISIPGNDSASTELPNEDEVLPKKKRSPPPDGLSRSAFKKLKKQQEWEAGKSDRRAKKKEKEKIRKAERREAKEAAIANGELPAEPVPAPRKHATQVPVTFVFDCNFDDLMLDQEIKSLASQITRCYSDNSRSTFKAHLAVSSFGGRLRERFDGPLEKQYAKWKGIRFFREDFVEVAEKAKVRMRDPDHGGRLGGALSQPHGGPGVTEMGFKTTSASQGDGGSSIEGGVEQDTNDRAEDVGLPQSTTLSALEQEGEVIYLSAESDNTLTELKPYSTYIIGGLVDRNRHKGICFKSANNRGVSTAKLPIGEFLQMNSRYVLTTNHVNEIMLRWLEVGDWAEAFMKVIPKRKGGALKGQGEGSAENGSLGVNKGDLAGDEPGSEGGDNDIDWENTEKPTERSAGVNGS